MGAKKESGEMSPNFGQAHKTTGKKKQINSFYDAL